MEIGRTNQAKLEGIKTLFHLEPDAVDERLADVAALYFPLFTIGDEQFCKQFEVRELIIHRQGRMGFRCTLVLRDFDQWLIPVSSHRISYIQRFAVGIHQREHPSITDILVVRYGQGIDTALPVRLHVGPQSFRLMVLRR